MKQDPSEQFSDWFEAANHDKEIYQANAMCISTINKNGFPTSRYVLLKEYNKSGLIFYTNLNSSKSRHLKRIPRIAVNFYWKPHRRQIRIIGTVEQVEEKKADSYYDSRPRASKIGAWASNQSQPLENREILQNRISDFEIKFNGKKVPRPEFWSGYRIIPNEYEFWQSGDDRLHDRFRYTKNDDGWKITRLYP